MNRRQFLQLTGSALAASIASPLLAQAAKRPNILWIISEDTSPDMACYGNPLVATPNLDRLADQGTIYDNAFASGPVCSAVRSGLMTGMYQTTIGAHNHRSHRGDGYRLPESVEVVTEYFRLAGYFTSNAAGLNFSRGGKTDWNFNPANEPFDGTDWRQRRPGQPFFAQVNLGMTHRNFRRDPQRPIDPDAVEVPPYYPDHPLTRRDWADYLESIQVLDREIGQVLDRLEQDGLADDTIVFYFGDHGRCHVRGKQWLYEGGIRIPLIIRQPGRPNPGRRCSDLVSTIDFAATALNLAGVPIPKHMEGRPFLGPEAKTRDHVICARDRCDETDDRIRCVRTARWKYIRNFHPDRPYTQFNAYKKNQYPVLTLMQVLHKRGELTPAQARFMAPTRPKEELYDLKADPHEIRNLADDPKHADTLDDLRNRLERWIQRTDDKGRYRESREVQEHWDKTMAGQYDNWMTRKGLSPNVSDEEYLAWWEEKMLGKVVTADLDA